MNFYKELKSIFFPSKEEQIRYLENLIYEEKELVYKMKILGFHPYLIKVISWRLSVNERKLKRII